MKDIAIALVFAVAGWMLNSYLTSLLSERSPQAIAGAGEPVRRVESPR